jgi:hypothetical protein
MQIKVISSTVFESEYCYLKNFSFKIEVQPSIVNHIYSIRICNRNEGIVQCLKLNVISNLEGP